MSKARIVMLGTDTNIEIEKDGEFQLFDDYEYGETLNAIYRRLKGKKLEDKYILSGPDTMGNTVNFKVAEGVLIALKMLAEGKDIEFVGHSRGAVQIKMTSHYVQKVLRIIQMHDIGEGGAIEKIIALILTAPKEATDFESYVASGFVGINAQADPARKHIIKFADKELDVEKLCSAIKSREKSPEADWFLIDPVPGQYGSSNWVLDEFFEIPDFVKRVVYKFQRHERSPFFEPILATKYKRECQVSVDSGPGHHGTASGGLYEQSVKASATKVGRDRKNRLATRHPQRLMVAHIIDFLGDDAFDKDETLKIKVNGDLKKTIDDVIVKYLKMSLKKRIEYKLNIYSKILIDMAQYQAFENTAYTGLNMLSKVGVAGMLGLSTPLRRLVLVGKGPKGAVAQSFEDIQMLRKPSFSGFVNKDHIHLWITHNSGSLQGSMKTAFPVLRFNYLADCFENHGKCDLVRVDSFAATVDAIDALETNLNHVYVRSSDKYDLVLLAVEADSKVEDNELEKISAANGGKPILYRHKNVFCLYGMMENGQWGKTWLKSKVFSPLNEKFEALLKAENKSEILLFANISAEMQAEIARGHISEHLFYVNKISKECMRIKIEKNQIIIFDKSFVAGSKSRSLSSEEIKRVNEATKPHFQFPDIPADSCQDHNQIKSMCGLFYIVIDEHVAHIVSLIEDINTNFDRETINQFKELMKAKDRLFKAIDQYASFVKSSKHADLHRELAHTWDGIAAQAYDQLYDSVNEQSAKLLMVSGNSESTEQEKIQTCLVVNQDLLEKWKRLETISETRFLDDKKIKAIENRIKEAIAFSHNIIREILNRKILDVREKIDVFFAELAATPLYSCLEDHDALKLELKKLQDEISKGNVETSQAVLKNAKEKLSLLEVLLNKYDVKFKAFKAVVEENAKAVEEVLESVAKIKTLFQSFKSDEISQNLIDNFDVELNLQAVKLERRASILTDADKAFVVHQAALDQLKNNLHFLVHQCRRQLMQSKLSGMTGHVNLLIDQTLGRDVLLDYTREHSQLCADFDRLKLSLSNIVVEENYQDLNDKIANLSMTRTEAESLLANSSVMQTVYQGKIKIIIAKVNKAYDELIANLGSLIKESDKETPGYEIDFFKKIKFLIEKLQQHKQLAVENQNKKLTDRLQELTDLQEDIHSKVIYRCEKTIEDLKAKQKTYEIQLKRLVRNISESEKQEIFDPCKQINIHYLKLIKRECEEILKKHPEDKSKLSETLDMVNGFVERKKGRYTLNALMQEASRYANDKRPHFHRLGVSMIALGVLSVLGLAALTFFTGGLNLIPTLIGGSLLLSAESGLGIYSIFGARMPKMNRLLENYAYETKSHKRYDN